jgi:transposase-like protein
MISTSSSDLSTSVPSPPIQNVPVTVDSKGRVRVSKEQRQVILAEFEQSGASAVQFAKRIGLKYSTLAGWLQRYRRTKPKGRARAVRLLEAVVAEAQGGDQNSSLSLQLPDGTRIEINNTKQAALAADLLRALARSC